MIHVSLFYLYFKTKIPYYSLSKFTNHIVMFPQMAFLEVVIPPDIIYEETSGDMMVPEGGSAKLTCNARGFPKPKIQWKREDGNEIIVRTGNVAKSKSTSAVSYGMNVLWNKYSYKAR